MLEGFSMSSEDDLPLVKGAAGAPFMGFDDDICCLNQIFRLHCQDDLPDVLGGFHPAMSIGSA